MENLKKDLQAVAGELNLLARRVEALVSAVETGSVADTQKTPLKNRRQGGGPRKKTGESVTTAGSLPVPSQKGKENVAEPETDANRKKILKMIAAMRRKGASYDQIARHLDTRGIPTFSGRGRWRKQTVHKLHQQLV